MPHIRGILRSFTGSRADPIRATKTAAPGPNCAVIRAVILRGCQIGGRVLPGMGDEVGRQVLDSGGAASGMAPVKRESP